MENKEIPRLKYRSPLLPDSIGKFIYKRDGGIIFNAQIKRDGVNAFVGSEYYRSFNNLEITEENKKALINDYITGFRKGYFEFNDTEDYHIVTTALTEDFPFIIHAMFSWNGLKDKEDQIETFDVGLENGQRYKAFELILLNPLKFRELFDEVIKKYNKKVVTETAPLVDFSDAKGTEKIVMLQQLGVLDFLKSQPLFKTSTNALANAISGFTGEKAETIQSYINPMNNPTTAQKNNPMTKEKVVSKVNQKLISIGYTPPE